MSDYKAVKPLYVGNARAHNPGDIVSAEVVKKYGWEDRVESLTKTEQKAVAKSEKEASEADGV